MREGMSGHSQPCNSYPPAPSYSHTSASLVWALFLARLLLSPPAPKGKCKQCYTQTAPKVLKDYACISLLKKSRSHRQCANLYVLKERWRGALQGQRSDRKIVWRAESLRTKAVGVNSVKPNSFTLETTLQFSQFFYLLLLLNSPKYSSYSLVLPQFIYFVTVPFACAFFKTAETNFVFFLRHP